MDTESTPEACRDVWADHNEALARVSRDSRPFIRHLSVITVSCRLGVITGLDSDCQLTACRFSRNCQEMPASSQNRTQATRFLCFNGRPHLKNVSDRSGDKSRPSSVVFDIENQSFHLSHLHDILCRVKN